MTGATSTAAGGPTGDNGAIVDIGDAVDEPVEAVDNVGAESTVEGALEVAGSDVGRPDLGRAEDIVPGHARSTQPFADIGLVSADENATATDE